MDLQLSIPRIEGVNFVRGGEQRVLHRFFYPGSETSQAITKMEKIRINDFSIVDKKGESVYNDAHPGYDSSENYKNDLNYENDKSKAVIDTISSDLVAEMGRIALKIITFGFLILVASNLSAQTYVSGDSVPAISCNK